MSRLTTRLFFAAKMWEFLTSCEERRLAEYERINWWDFIEAGSRSRRLPEVFRQRDHALARRRQGPPRQHQDHRRHLRPDRLQHPAAGRGR